MIEMINEIITYNTDRMIPIENTRPAINPRQALDWIDWYLKSTTSHQRRQHQEALGLILIGAGAILLLIHMLRE